MTYLTLKKVDAKTFPLSFLHGINQIKFNMTIASVLHVSPTNFISFVNHFIHSVVEISININDLIKSISNI